MKKNRLLNKGVALFLFLMFILFPPFPPLAKASLDDEKKNEMTTSLGLFYSASLTLGLFSPKVKHRPTFGIGFERKISPHYSVAVSFAYAIPSEWYDDFNSSGRVEEEFCRELGRGYYYDFTEIWEKRSAFILDVGFYRYFGIEGEKKGNIFLYFGTGYMAVREEYWMIDNESDVDKKFSTLEGRYTILDLGFGYKYRLEESCFIRAEWRMHGFIIPLFGGDPMYDSFLLGLSYRF